MNSIVRQYPHMTMFPQFPTNKGNHYYTVKPGDTLPTIAFRLGIPNWTSILNANRHLFGATFVPQAGDRLIVPRI